MMNETVARIVEIMFQDVEMNDETSAIRDEVMNNCQERYLDLVSSGVNEDDAIAAVIESLKGMEEVLAPYKRKAHRHEAADNENEEDSGERDLSFTAEEIHRIDLCLVNEDLKIEPSDDDAFHVIWDANANPLVHAYMQDGVLKVERDTEEAVKMKKDGDIEYHPKDNTSDFVKKEKGRIEINFDSIDGMLRSIGESLKNAFSNARINIGFGDSEVTVKVPEYAVPHMKLLTTSGDIDVQDVTLADLDITSTSGDVNVALDANEYLKQVQIRTTSGDVEATAYTHEMTIASTSGDVDAEGYYHNLTVNTISGDIDVRADVKNMIFKAVSGDVDLEFDSEEIRDVRGSTISGDIDIDLPSDIGTIAINTQTRSGDVTTRHHCDGVGPTVTGSVTSMSGDITIS